MGIVYGASNLFFKSALRAFGKCEVVGKENVPREGALIVVSNHISNIDPVILNVSIPRRVKFMAKAELFEKPLISNLFKAYGAFPINENGREFQAINHSLAILNRKDAMGIFPEGAMNPGSLGKAMLGTAMIAMMSDAPILPVGITGTESVERWRQICYPKGTFKIAIGKPFSLHIPKNVKMRKNMETVTDTIMHRIAELLPEDYRGVYHHSWEGERDYTSPPDWWRQYYADYYVNSD